MKRNRLFSHALGLIFVIPASCIGLSSCSLYTSSKYFAEIVVSTNSSVLKDNSFSQTTYDGWYHFASKENGTDKTKTVTNLNGNPSTYQIRPVDMKPADSPAEELKQAKGVWRRPGLLTENTFNWIFEGGVNTIIASGFSLASSVEAVAPKYKEMEKGFILLDSPVNHDLELYNVATFTFAAQQSGFLSGIATGEFLKANKDIFGSGGLKAGGYAGLDLPTTMDFFSGFQAGLIAYNLKETDKNNKVEWVNLGNNIDAYLSNSFNVGEATTISNTLIDKGADMIITISGPQVVDTISAIKTHKDGRAVAVVGVDTAQEENPAINEEMPLNLLKEKKIKNADGTVSTNQNVIQFSAIKKLDEAAYSILAAIFNTNDYNNIKKIQQLKTESSKNGNNVNFPVGGFGFENTGTFENKSVGISNAGLQYVKSFNQNWVQENSNGVEEFVPNPSTNDASNTSQSVYDNPAYKILQQGQFYNIGDNVMSTITADTLSTLQPVQHNRPNYFNPLTSNSIAPIFHGGKDITKSLNGSKWSLLKVGAPANASLPDTKKRR